MIKKGENMKIDPAQIPAQNQGTKFEVPKYEPKEVSVFNDKSIMTENYMEEVDNILDKDGDGLDELGREVTRYLDNSGDGKTDSVHYFEYDEQGNKTATYFDGDNDGKINSAEYYEHDEQGNNIGTYFDHGNNGEIDYAEYYEYDEQGNRISMYRDTGNDGEIDSARYYEYDEQGNSTAIYFDGNNDGIIDSVDYRNETPTSDTQIPEDNGYETPTSGPEDKGTGKGGAIKDKDPFPKEVIENLKKNQKKSDDFLDK